MESFKSKQLGLRELARWQLGCQLFQIHQPTHQPPGLRQKQEPRLTTTSKLQAVQNNHPTWKLGNCNSTLSQSSALALQTVVIYGKLRIAVATISSCSQEVTNGANIYRHSLGKVTMAEGRHTNLESFAHNLHECVKDSSAQSRGHQSIPEALQTAFVVDHPLQGCSWELES